MAKKKPSELERWKKSRPGEKRLRDLSPAERAEFHARMAEIFKEMSDAPKRALRAANLPENHAEAFRIMLFDHDPAIALEPDESFDDIQIDVVIDTARVYAARERSRAAFQENTRKAAAEVYRRENIANERDELLQLCQALSPSTDSSFEGFCKAFGVWANYPIHLANIGVFDDQPANVVAFQASVSLLESCHGKATELLTRRANTLGIDIGAIHSAAELKVELFETDPKRYFHSEFGCTWPQCLGPARHELTADQQNIITRGEEAIRQLWVEVTAGQQEGPPAPNGTPGRKPNPENRNRADKANKMRSMSPQSGWKEIAASINSDPKLKNPNKKYTAESIRSLHRHYYPPSDSRNNR